MKISIKRIKWVNGACWRRISEDVRQLTHFPLWCLRVPPASWGSFYLASLLFYDWAAPAQLFGIVFAYLPRHKLHLSHGRNLFCRNNSGIMRRNGKAFWEGTRGRHLERRQTEKGLRVAVNNEINNRKFAINSLKWHSMNSLESARLWKLFQRCRSFWIDSNK